MSFWKNLFGTGGGDATDGAPGGPEEEYKGFTIRATLQSAGSEFQLAGSIERNVDGELKRHDFVRADRFGSKSDAQAAALAKGRQIIDERGDRVFDQPTPVRH